AEISRADGWRMDLSDYVRQLEARHVDPYHSISREALAAQVKRLRDNADKLTDAQLAVGLLQVVASVGDGHTTMWLPGQIFDHGDGFRPSPRIPAFHRYPIALELFADGWFVVEAHPDFKACVG